MAFSIKELEHLSGIKAHTIRIWEQRYHFIKPSRTDTNIRTYSTEELKTLLTVALLNKYGYKISHIDEMQPEQRNEALMQLVEAKDEYLINKLIGCMVDIDHVQFEAIFNQYMEQNGLDQTITTLTFLFLEKVGILWHTSHINAAQEHIVSNIIRQKIISAIDRLMPVVTQHQSLFLLLLPEYEYHELGLLFVYYLLRKNGHPVLYLGASVPISDATYVIQIKKPAFLYLHLTSFPAQLQFEKYLLQLSFSAPEISIFISGSFISEYKKTIPSNVTFLKSLSEVTTFINNLNNDVNDE